MEVEAWLASVDPRRLHSLQKTSSYLCTTLEAADSEKSELGCLSIPLRLPASLHTHDRISFVGLGWPKMSSRFEGMTPSSEKIFLSQLLQELNHELALQLDTEPKVDRLLHTPEVDKRQVIIVCGGSHACRLAEAIGATHPEVVDLSIG